MLREKKGRKKKNFIRWEFGTKSRFASKSQPSSQLGLSTTSLIPTSIHLDPFAKNDCLPAAFRSLETLPTRRTKHLRLLKPCPECFVIRAFHIGREAGRIMEPRSLWQWPFREMNTPRSEVVLDLDGFVDGTRHS